MLLELLDPDHGLARNREAARANVQADRLNAQKRQVFLEGATGNPHFLLHGKQGDVFLRLGVRSAGGRLLWHDVLLSRSVLRVFHSGRLLS